VAPNPAGSTTDLLTVTVRHFAAARSAAGADVEERSLPVGATVADLVLALGEGRPELARVLLRCSFLHDEVAVRDREDLLRPGSVLDVLPPFAGG
jgi:molybdopterin synthase sulfur carrier subunit